MDTKAYQIYEQDKLYFTEPVISHTYTREYHLPDHLGNVRVVLDEKGELVQQTDYYPFGMSFTQADFSADNANKYLYNGKELQTEFDINWYDYGARFYDAAIGRFHTFDPMAEKFSFQSLYAYAGNNPIKYIDVDGMYFGDSTMINEVEEAANKAINREQKRQERLRKRINKRQDKGRSTSRLKKRKNKSVSRQSVLEDFVFAIDEMRKDPNVKFDVDWGWDNAGQPISGYTEAKNENHVIFHISESYGTKGLVHEMVHGSQYLNGSLDFNGDRPGLLYDLWDEAEAYTVESAYNGFSSFQRFKPSTVLSTYSSSYSGYNNLPTVRLHKNSTMGAIRLTRMNHGVYYPLKSYTDMTSYKNAGLPLYFK